ECAGEHPPPAGAARGCCRALPDTHPPRARFGVVARAIDVRIEAPARLTGLRIECDHDVRAGLDVQQAEGEHRRCLEGEPAGARQARAQLAGAIGPGHRKVRDVAAVDLIETGVALTERVTAVVAPVARR